MSLSDLRKELKDLRKKSSPVPISRMKKADCAAELARLKGTPAATQSVEVPVHKEKEEKKPKKVAIKEEKEPEVKKTKGVKSAPVEGKPKKEAKKDDKPKPAKGSEEMKARMAKLREARKAKKDA